MQTIEVGDWAGFEKRLQDIRQAEVSAGRSEQFLFRGVSDSDLKLDTTLERAKGEQTRIRDYFKLISKLQPQVESFTGRTWETAMWQEVDQSRRDWDAFALHKFPGPALYSYMVHLRHCGFPSPLLDWTRSPYVAAFFAFRSSRKPCSEKVSIYAFSESPIGAKITSNQEALIHRMGPHVRTHRRHFLQQSEYTMCVALSEEWHFVRHEDVTQGDNTDQDVLWKFNIPWKERLKVLKLLDDYNLHAFSLFESEEALMETLALRAMELKA